MAKQVATVECGKCEGKGRLWFYGHYAQGVCFTCGGAGRLEGHTLSARAQARAQAAHAVDVLVEAAEQGVRNETWVTHICKRAAVAMLEMRSTDEARTMLARLPAAMRAEVIALGRELKAG